MSELTYTKVGDYLFPNISLPQQSMKPLNKYGRMRKKFLMEHQPLIFQTMLLNGTLDAHLSELNQQAMERKETLIRQMAAKEGITQELKAADPMARVQRMNNLRACAEEIILKELVYD